MFHAVISGVGSYLPARRLANSDFERMVETTDEWIVTRTGIAERRIADDSEATSDLAFRAAQAALETAGLAASDVDLLIVATSTPDHPFPPSRASCKRAWDAARSPRLMWERPVSASFLRWRLPISSSKPEKAVMRWLSGRIPCPASRITPIAAHASCPVTAQVPLWYRAAWSKTVRASSAHAHMQTGSIMMTCTCPPEAAVTPFPMRKKPGSKW